MKILLRLQEASEPLEFHALNTYTKGNLLCIRLPDDSTVKFPLCSIFSVKEYSDYYSEDDDAQEQGENEVITYVTKEELYSRAEAISEDLFLDNMYQAFAKMVSGELEGTIQEAQLKAIMDMLKLPYTGL